jgi:hypothetical protein
MKRNTWLLQRSASLLTCLAILVPAANIAAQNTQSPSPTTAESKIETASRPETDVPPVVPAQDPPTVRIGVVYPMMKMVETSQAANTSDAIRNVLIQYMSGPRVEIVPLTSRIPAHIEPEARLKNCDFVLYSTLILKKSGGTSRFGGMLKRLAPAAALIALGGGSMKNVVSTATRVTMEVLGEVTIEKKKKDEITFEYRLVTIGGALPVIQDSFKGKAKEESEDILTEMIVKTAESTVIAALRGYSDQIAAKRAKEQQQQDSRIAGIVKIDDLTKVPNP